MKLRRVAMCLFVLAFVGPLSARPDDMSSKIKTFCNDKVRLTENSITFSVKQIVSAGGGQKSTTTALDSVSTVEISMMHLNCNLFVAQMITQQQFLDKQTEILQFALDLESLRALAEAKAASQPQKKDTAPSADQATKPAEGSGTDSASTKTKDGNSSDSAASKGGAKSGDATKGGSQNGKSSTDTKQNSGQSVIKSIAVDLGITLKSSTGVSQSGHHDLVNDGVTYVISKYSPIPVQK